MNPFRNALLAIWLLGLGVGGLMLIASIVVPYSMAWAGVLGGGLFQLGAVALLIWLGVMAVQHKPDGA